MARSRRNVVLRHIAAMNLMLSMQDATGAFFNVTYVITRSTVDARGVAKPPSGPPLDAQGQLDVAQLEAGLDRLQDFFALVDEGIYDAYFQLLTAGLGAGPSAVTAPIASQTFGIMSKILRLTTDEADAAMWCGSVHPNRHVLREVVSDLLA